MLMFVAALALPAWGASDADERMSVSTFDDIVRTANQDSTAHPDALDRALGMIHGDDPDARGLRDRLLLIKGYRALDALQPERARSAFGAISEPGAQTNAALLGLGWSYLYPDVRERAQRTLAMQLVSRRLGFFSTWSSVASGRQAELVKHALVAWEELIGRNPLDPAVQESMVAIPYALDHLGAFDDALDYRVHALEMLGRVDAALQASRDDGSVDWIVAQAASGTASGQPWFASLPQDKWWLKANIDPPRAFYWRDALDDDAVTHALLALRADPGADRQPLKDALLACLTRLQQGTEVYLAESRLATAREYDPHGEVAP
jgi:hypothetical protein